MRHVPPHMTGFMTSRYGAMVSACCNTWCVDFLFEIIKNFYTATQFRDLFDDHGCDLSYAELDHFWVLRYCVQ